VSSEPGAGHSYNPDVAVDAEHLGITDDVKELGTRIYRRTMRELHSVVCGSAAEDRKDRESLLSAIGADDIILGAAIASVLTTSFAMAPAVRPSSPLF
jgi:hypothetical protein